MATTRRGGCDGFWGIRAAGDSQCAAYRSTVLFMAVPGLSPAAGGGSCGTIPLAVHAMGVDFRDMRGDTESCSDSWASPVVEV